jgi:hypothetical protein
VATFNDLVLNVAGDYTLKATSGDLDPDTSDRFTVAPAAVTSGVRVYWGRVRLDASGLYEQAVTLTNTSGRALGGPLVLSVTGLPHGTSLANASGTYQGSPYVRLNPAGDSLGAGKSFTVVLTFSVSGPLARRGRQAPGLHFDLEVLQGL